MMAEPREKQRTQDALFRAVVESVNALPTLLRRVFILSHYRGCDLEEIAHKVGRTVSETRSILQQANARFSHSLSRPRFSS